ncbi:MAG: hypothetical protein HYZ53_24850 [Planctomycetes bacterium]|nr:hypothetical protein [Planctomycetota bacterium]
MISCGIMVIVVAATLTILIASQRSLDSEVAANALDADARNLIERLARELRQAGANTLIPANPNKSTTLAFQQCTGYAAGLVLWGTVTTYSLVDMPAGLPSQPLLKACVRQSGATSLTIGSNLVPNGLWFTRTATGLDVSVTLQRTLPGGQAVTRTAQTSIALRN